MNQSIGTETSTDLTLEHDFNESASTPQKKKHSSQPAPFSLRFTADERAYLDQLAGNQALGAYIRDRLLGERAVSRRKLRKPSIDDEKAAALLAELMHSHVPSNLNQIAKAANNGTFNLRGDTELQLQQACAAVIAMREALFIALGLRTGGSL